jgi:hypothetical protein
MQLLCVPATGSQFLVSTVQMLSETGTLVLKYCMKNSGIVKYEVYIVAGFENKLFLLKYLDFVSCTLYVQFLSKLLIL